MSEKSLKSQALAIAMKQIEKNFGKGSIMHLGKNFAVKIDTVSTGSLSLDIALGIGGFPKGRIIEIFGPESSGKTTVALHAVAQVQKTGGVCAFIDAEHALDPIYANKLGVNTKDLLLSQPDNGEQALEITDTLIRSSAVDLIVIDSVAALVPKAEIEGDMGDSHMGLQARLMSQALRKLTASVSKTGCIIIFINQIRMKIGIMFGNPETTTGGNALKFYSSLRLEIRKVSSLKEQEKVVGNQVRVRIVKNKLAPPFKQVEFNIIYGLGISKLDEVVDLSLSYNLIQKSGSWYAYDGKNVGQGRDAVKEYLRNEAKIVQDLEKQIMLKAFSENNTDFNNKEKSIEVQ